MHYLDVKGRTEKALLALNLGQVRFYRPSQLLAPNRANLSTAEALQITVFRAISPLLVGPLTGWRGITPAAVAVGMVNNVAHRNPGPTYTYRQMVGTSYAPRA